MRARMATFAWALSSLLLLPALASAQGADDLEQDARLHFELGTRAYERGEFTTAADAFAEAYRLSGRPALLYNMYVAHRDAQLREEAAEDLRRYLREAGEIPNRARLEVVLAQLEAELAGQPPPPEPHAERGDRAETRPSPSSGGADPVGPIVVTAIGAAALVASAITGGLALARNGELSDACPADVCADGSARGIQSDVETLSITTDILWPVGAVAAAVGLIWLVVELGASSDDARASLACGPTGCEASVRGTF